MRATQESLGSLTGLNRSNSWAEGGKPMFPVFALNVSFFAI